jgi:ferredoxin-NADP reductase
MALEQFELSLIASRSLGAGILHLDFVRTDGKALAFVPGQFITLLLKNEAGELKRRSYSLANPPQGMTLSIAISYVKGGIASEQLFHLQLGDTLKAMGPAGRLVLQDDAESRYILVGTGTGIAPYRAMLPELAKRLKANPALNVEIILGVQTREAALYQEDFLNFAAAHPRCRFHAALSRETTPLLPHERKCYVQDYFAQLNLSTTEDVFYLCGNPNMIDQAFALLTEAGFPSPSIRREKYISSN